jgi:hypothetical protein
MAYKPFSALFSAIITPSRLTDETVQQDAETSRMKR